MPFPDILYSLLLLSGLLFSLSYMFVIYRITKGWRSLPLWQVPGNYRPGTQLTLLIPARNEEGNITTCLQSLTYQDYPFDLLEVIVIDDHSTDRTFEQARDFSSRHQWVRVVRLEDHLEAGPQQSYKKKALELGNKLARGELIVTTDADCTYQPGWLSLMASFYEHHRFKFIAAPVNFHRGKSLFERFQSLDFMGMMCLTGGGLQLNWMHMCNGANLAYTRSAFYAVNGFTGIDHLASGDDMMLMQKMAAHYPGQLGFVKTPFATVFTDAKPNLPSFIAQRLRWTTKSSSYRERKIIVLLGIVYFDCLLIITCFLLIPVWGMKVLLLLLTMLAAKFIADYYLLRTATRFFMRKELMKIFLPAQFLHILYISVVGTLGNIKKKYHWKDRTVR